MLAWSNFPIVHNLLFSAVWSVMVLLNISVYYTFMCYIPQVPY